MVTLDKQEEEKEEEEGSLPFFFFFLLKELIGLLNIFSRYLVLITKRLPLQVKINRCHIIIKSFFFAKITF